jgi:acyl-CoA oxidase
MRVELKDLAPILLKKERKNGDIDVELLTSVIRGSQKQNARRKELVNLIAKHPVLKDRDMMFRNHTERYNFALKKAYHYVKLIEDEKIDTPEDRYLLYRAIGEPLPIDVHRSMFIPTLENQADPEQQNKWLELAKEYRILGAYAQTELGHGSNVQGIETIATFDKASQEFIINSPTLTSRKWWPGGLGKTANHAIVHARLFIDGKDRGVQAFIVQLRSLKDHTPLPGIEIGDIGPKVGFNPIDNGYCAFDHVRIPRENMLMRFAKVLPDGTFIKPKTDKFVYLTMVHVRSHLVLLFAEYMARAVTITARFSAARIQGHASKKVSKGEIQGEFQVLDYQNQQYAIFPLLGYAFAGLFAGKDLVELHNNAVESIKRGDPNFSLILAELHGASSGLKALGAEIVSDGIEKCRRQCGGHGFSDSSNLSHFFKEIVGACTFEGTFDVLVQQHARYLFKVFQARPVFSQQNKNDNLNVKGFLTRADEHLNPSARCAARIEEDFLNFEILLYAFEVRVTRIIARLTKAMMTTKKDLNKCMLLCSRASIAHSELLYVSSFIHGVKQLPSGKTKEALANLCVLFALSRMINSLGEFRDGDFISTDQGEVIYQLTAKLLPIIRKNVILLTDAWDVSDFELNSAIGRFDGDIYRALVERAKDEPLNKTQVPDGYEAYLKPLLKSNL